MAASNAFDITTEWYDYSSLYTCHIIQYMFPDEMSEATNMHIMLNRIVQDENNMYFLSIKSCENLTNLTVNPILIEVRLIFCSL